MQILFNTSIGLFLFGLVVLVFKPRYGNFWLGFASKAMLDSEEQWNLGQKVSGILLLILSGILFVLSQYLNWEPNSAQPIFILLGTIFTWRKLVDRVLQLRRLN